MARPWAPLDLLCAALIAWPATTSGLDGVAGACLLSTALAASAPRPPIFPGAVDGLAVPVARVSVARFDCSEGAIAPRVVLVAFGDPHNAPGAIHLPAVTLC